jgi:hypothetical protein
LQGCATVPSSIFSPRHSLQFETSKYKSTRYIKIKVYKNSSDLSTTLAPSPIQQQNKCTQPQAKPHALTKPTPK